MSIFGTLGIEWQGNIDQLNSELGKADKSLERSAQQMGQTLGRVGRTLTASITAPILGAATAAIKLNDDFQAASLTIRRETGLMGRELTQMRDQALELSTELPRGLNEISTVLASVSGGFQGSNSQIEELTENIIFFSQVTGVDAVAAAGDLGNIIGANNGTIEDAVDLLSALESITAQYGANVENVVSSMASARLSTITMNMSLEEQVVAFSQLEAAGISARDFFRPFRRALRQGEIEGDQLTNTINDLTQSFTQLGEEETIAMLNDLGITDVDDVIRGLSVVDLGDIEGSLEDMGISLEDLSDNFMTFGERMLVVWNQIKNSLQPAANMVAIMFEDQVVPAIENATEILTSALSRLLEAAELMQQWRDEGTRTQKMLVGIADSTFGFIIALGPLLLGLQALLFVGGKLVGVLRIVYSLFMSLFAIPIRQSTFNLLPPIIQTLNEKLTALSLAFRNLFTNLRKNIIPILRKFEKELGREGIKPITSLTEKYIGWVKSIKTVAKSLLSLRNILSIVFSWTTAIVGVISYFISGFDDLQHYTDFLRGKLIILVQALKKINVNLLIVRKAGEFLSNTFSGLINTVVDFIETQKRNINGFIENHKWLKTTINTIKNLIGWIGKLRDSYIDFFAAYGKAQRKSIERENERIDRIKEQEQQLKSNYELRSKLADELGFRIPWVAKLERENPQELAQSLVDELGSVQQAMDMLEPLDLDINVKDLKNPFRKAYEETTNVLEDEDIDMPDISTQVSDTARELERMRDEAIRMREAVRPVEAFRREMKELANITREMPDILSKSVLFDVIDEEFQSLNEETRNSIINNQRLLDSFGDLGSAAIVMSHDMDMTRKSMEEQSNALNEFLERQDEAQRLMLEVRPIKEFQDEMQDILDLHKEFGEILDNEVLTDLFIERLLSLPEELHLTVLENERWLEVLGLTRNELFEIYQAAQETPDLFEQWVESLSNAGSEMMEIGRTVGSELLQNVGSATQAISSMMETTSEIVDVFNDVSTEGKSSFNTVMNFAKAAAGDIFALIASVVELLDIFGLFGEETEEELYGLDKFMDELGDKLEDWGEQLTESLVNFVKEGRAEIRKLVDQILTDLAQLGIQTAITDPIVAQISHMWPFAKGGAFTGSVIKKPTAFNMGLMGEAGPEAIMPLQKVNGQLGVAAEGTSSPTNVQIHNYSDTNVNVQERMINNQKQLEIFIEEKVNQSFTKGNLDNTMKGEYGLHRKGFKR